MMDDTVDYMREDDILQYTNTAVPLSGGSRRYARYENSYRTDPVKLFPYYKAKSIMYSILQSSLEGIESYDPSQCAQLVTELCVKIRNTIRDMKIPRYRIMCIVHIGQKESHGGLMVGSRCIWNSEHDTFTSTHYSNSCIYAAAIMFAVYLE